MVRRKSPDQHQAIIDDEPNNGRNISPIRRSQSNEQLPNNNNKKEELNKSQQHKLSRPPKPLKTQKSRQQQQFTGPGVENEDDDDRVLSSPVLTESDFKTNAFLASLIMAGGVSNSNQNNNSSQRSQMQQQLLFETNNNHNTPSNNNNGYRVQSSSVKSGSLPGRYSGSGGSSNLVLSTSPSGSTPSPAGQYYYHPSGHYSPEGRRQQIRTNYGFHHQQQQLPPPMSTLPTSLNSPSEFKEKESSKKWNPFGGLFKRKDKSGGAGGSDNVKPSKTQKNIFASSPNRPTISAPIIHSQSASSQAVPIQIQFEASQRPVSKVNVVSSGASDNGSLSDSDDDDKNKSNFLVRKLSGRKKKKSSSKSRLSSGAESDLLKVPSLRPAGSKNGAKHSSNRHSQPILQSWETTKKATLPPTSSSSLMLNVNPNNYSSSGSLSLSADGFAGNKGPRFLKEATKARAEARRNSYINESSSEEDGGSIQGSHSSLSLRTGKKGNGTRAGNGNNGVLLTRPPPPNSIQLNARNSPLNPQTLGLPTSAPQQHSDSSPAFLNYPPSPRWEARVIYTQENLHEDDKPVVVKLPKYYHDISSNNNYMLTTERISHDVDSEQVVVTAGFKVPVRSGARIQDSANGEPIYANLPTEQSRSKESPVPPKRDFSRQQQPNFYRPVSCSYLDSYQQKRPIVDPNAGGRGVLDSQPQSILQYDKEPSRLKSPSTERQLNNGGTPYYYSDSQQSQPAPLIDVPDSAALLPRKLASPASPIHSNASAFWKQKEAEIIASGDGVSPLLQQQQQPSRILTSRIRSADSSPLLLPKSFNNNNINNQNKQKSPGAATTGTATGVTPAFLNTSLNSTESISSLSSFTNETTPSPNMFSKNSPVHLRNRNSSTPTNATTTNANNNGVRNKIPPGFQQRNSYRSSNSGGRDNVRAFSANERLGLTSPGSGGQRDPNDGGNGSRSSIKSPGKNLEDALNELEDMYKSLRLSDEDLLDRAERRDLPTPHQELRNKDLGYFNFDDYNSNSRIGSPMYNYYSPSPTLQQPPFGTIGSLESLTNSNTSGSGEHAYSKYPRPVPRVRAPPLRRSACPDLVNDDMAKRKYDAYTKDPKVVDSREQISQTGSYLVLSPAFSPPVSPIPSSLDTYYSPHLNYNPSAANLLQSNANDPDLTMDDVTVRNYKRANAIRIIPEPQPKFGIPLGPVSAAPNSDYLHSIPTEKFRPLYRHVKNPDIVKDDIAFRALRKDLNQEQNNLSNKDWTPKLFSPLRNFENVFNYNLREVDDQLRAKNNNKKARAVRSLSANIMSQQQEQQRQQQNNNGLAPYPPLNSYSLLRKELSHWHANENKNNRLSRSLTPAGADTTDTDNKVSVTNYLEPSWVQQIELDQDELRELKRSLSPNRLIPLIRTKNVNAISSSYHTPIARSSSSPASSSDNSKPRRPWTDIILDSFEKERQVEIERQEQLEQFQRESNGHYPVHETQYPRDEDDDDEIFVDASQETPRDSPERSRSISVPKVSSIQLKSFNNDSYNIHGHGQPQPKSTFYNNNKLLLNGQKNRRGSWVASETERIETGNNKLLSSGDKREHELLMKRRSWSDFPQQQFGSYPPATTQFNPIPPPRRVKQINLDGFHSSVPKNKENDDHEKHKEPVHCFEAQPTVKSSGQDYLAPSSYISPTSTRDEQQLDDLIDALVKDADTCGHGTSKSKSDSQSFLDWAATPTENEKSAKRTRKLEIKARYPFDDEEDANFGRRGQKSSPTEEYREEQASETSPSEQTYSIVTNRSRADNPISRLIETINEKLVPSLEESIKGSETRMSNRNLAAASAPNEAKQEPTTSSSAKPTPLPRSTGSKTTDTTDTSIPTSSSKFSDTNNSAISSSSNKNTHDDDKNDSVSKKMSQFKESAPASEIPTMGVLVLGRKRKEDTTGTGLSAIGAQYSPVAPKKDTPSMELTSPILTPKLTLGKWQPQPQSGAKIPTVQDQAPSAQQKSSSAALISPAPFRKSTAKKDSNTGDNSDYKRDSLSDAEGISALKKLLKKEKDNDAANNSNALNAGSDSGSNYCMIGGIKKSPSVGCTPTTTSIPGHVPFHHQSPLFLKKYFPGVLETSNSASRQKQAKADENIRADPSGAVAAKTTDPAPEDTKSCDVLALNVAQKANLFMKLEHDQRFSKWRKNSDVGADAGGGPGGVKEPSSGRISSSRFSTQPVTTSEISKALLNSQNQKNSENDGLISNTKLDTQTNRLTLSKNNDDHDGSKHKAQVKIEPSCLSIKDRVSLFNRMSTTSSSVVPSPGDSDQQKASTGRRPSTNTLQQHQLNSSTSGLDSSYDNLLSPKWTRRRSSLSDTSTLPQQQPISQTSSSGQNNSARGGKVKSLFLGQSWEPDYVSEDGEVSSGGQEVSEIISKSYDNSPMFRKKSWKSQLPQPNLSKEIWRRVEHSQNSKPNNTTSSQDPGPTQSSSNKPALLEETKITEKPEYSKEIMSPGATEIKTSTTSNLLPILKVLSCSSDDQIEDDPPHPSFTNLNRKGSKDLSAKSASASKKSTVRKYLKMRSETGTTEKEQPTTVESTTTPDVIRVRVPHPDDVSFQNFFKTPTTVTEEGIYDNVSSASPSADPSTASATNAQKEELSSVKREGDMLVMKKNMPLVRRKSSGRSSKNPLKALAARMDFHNQEYSKT